MPTNRKSWPKGCRAAVSLTYDDGIASHHRDVAPQLEAYYLRGTFYAPLASDLMQNPLAWRGMAQRGHELGNHTVFHPCWSIQNRYADWLPEAFNLVDYDEERWIDEIRTANQALALVDGKRERTFGNTCFDNWLGPEEEPICLEPFIETLFLAARGEDTGKPVNLDAINYNNLGTVWADRRVFADFVPELEALVETGGWVIYTMHGVGVEAHTHHIALAEHLRLLEYLRQNDKNIWTAPVIEIVRHLKR
jgi:peptidoglycan/xylan/chitin deacetylase (PgdA/CDA1 family)